MTTATVASGGRANGIGALEQLRRLWRYRALLENLVNRDLRVRYRNSVFGFGWSLLSPLLLVVVFTFVFTVLLRSAPNRVPFPAFILVGILPWNFFSTSVLGSMDSITGNAGLIEKVNFPREVLPIGTVLANAVNFLLAILVLIPVTFLFGIDPSLLWALFPLIFIAQTCFVLGIALALAAVNVYFRDTEYILDILLIAWFFLTPIFYDVSQVFTQWNGLELSDLLLLLNPMAAYVTAYRDVFLMHEMPDPLFLFRSFAIGLITCFAGFAIFARSTRGFGDVL